MATHPQLRDPQPAMQWNTNPCLPLTQSPKNVQQDALQTAVWSRCCHLCPCPPSPHLKYLSKFVMLPGQKANYYPIRCWCPKCVRNSYNSIAKTNKQTKIQSKNGQRTWKDISPRKTYRWPTGIWNIANHQGHANQNYSEISPHTCQNGHHQNVSK